MTGEVLDGTGALWTGMTLPDCAVVDHQTNTDGTVIDTTLAPCPLDNMGQPVTTGPTACWHLDAGGTVCPGAASMGFYRPGGVVTTDLNSSVSCSVRACPPAGTPNPPTGC